MASSEVARQGKALTTGAKLPEAFNKIIHFEGWAQAVVNGSTYSEPEPDFISRMLAVQAITADTVEQVWQAAGVKQLQKMIPDLPGASTGPLEITDLYVAESDFETGNPTYVIITATHLEQGDERKFTTGATNVQATLIGLLRHGMWPIRCQIKRGDSKDKGGRYLLFMLPPD
jgi:hypothetical protein